MVGANRECSLPSSPFFQSVACDPFAFMQASDSVPAPTKESVASVIMAEAQLKVAFAARGANEFGRICLEMSIGVRVPDTMAASIAAASQVSR